MLGVDLPSGDAKSTAMMRSDVESMLTVAEVAERWRVAILTVRRMIGDGRVRGVRIGKQWRIRLSEVERVEAEGAAKPAA